MFYFQIDTVTRIVHKTNELHFRRVMSCFGEASQVVSPGTIYNFDFANISPPA